MAGATANAPSILVWIPQPVQREKTARQRVVEYRSVCISGSFSLPPLLDGRGTIVDIVQHYFFYLILAVIIAISVVIILTFLVTSFASQDYFILVQSGRTFFFALGGIKVCGDQYAVQARLQVDLGEVLLALDVEDARKSVKAHGREEARLFAAVQRAHTAHTTFVLAEEALALLAKVEQGQLARSRANQHLKKKVKMTIRVMKTSINDYRLPPHPINFRMLA